MATVVLAWMAVGNGPVWCEEGAIVDRARPPRDTSPGQSPPAAATAKLPEPPSAAPGDSTPLGVKIRSLRLLARQEQVNPEGGEGKDGEIWVGDGINLPKGAMDLLRESYLGKEASMALFSSLTRDLIQAYRDSDFPLVDVYLPEQNITQGTIQVIVREAFLGGVRVEGAKHSRPGYLKSQVRVEQGEKINSRVVERDLEWLNENPIRTVRLIYERGKEDGTSDIVLDIKERRPFEFSFGYANSGVNATGQGEWSGGITYFNVLGTEQSLSYSFTGDTNLGNLNAHALVYQIPFPWRHTLRLIGAYVVSESDISNPLFPLGMNGESIQATAEYQIPLPRIQPDWRSHFTVAADYKSTNTDLLFGGESFFAGLAEIFQFRFGVDWTIPDAWGVTQVSLGMVTSPGDVLRRNTDEDFDLLRLDAKANYWYTTFGLQRYQKLPAKFGLVLRAEAQYTDERLIPTEQIIAGGYRTVRGVDENLIRGDSGGLVSAQLMFPPVSLHGKKAAHAAAWDDELIPYGFYDTAFLYETGELSSEPNPSLQTVGMGVSYRLGERMNARAAYGWCVGESGVDGVENGRFHFGVQFRY